MAAKILQDGLKVQTAAGADALTVDGSTGVGTFGYSGFTGTHTAYGAFAISTPSASAQLCFGRTGTAVGWGYLGATSTDALVVASGGTGSSPSYGTQVLRIYQAGIYASTTASAANVFTGSDNVLLRSTSALKYKTNVRDLELGLPTVCAMKPVRYNSLCNSDDKDTEYIGFIADWEEERIPECVAKNAEGEVEGFAYERVTAVLVKAIQEQQAMIEALQAEVAALKG